MAGSLNKIVDVSVKVSSPTTISSDFNLGMIIDNRADSPIANQVKEYTYSNYQAQMVADGFATTDAAYKKAVVYFSQSEKSSRLAVAGTGAAEAADAAFTRIRNENDKFWAFCFAATVTDENIAKVAALVESSKIPTIYFFGTSDEKCTQASTANVLKTLQTAQYTRTFGFYSEDVNIDVAMVGLVSGLNSMKANSAYTAAYKTLIGVVASDLSDTQINNIASYGGNFFGKFGNTYKLTYPCISVGNYHVDELFLIDAASLLIQQEVIAGLVATKKVPQTESGVDMLVAFAARACNTLENIGLIGGGIWNGEQVLSLNPGDAISNGYYIEAESVASQTPADRTSRISPPIYVALLATGAIEHVVINVIVER